MDTDGALHAVVRDLCRHNGAERQRNDVAAHRVLPSREALLAIMGELRAALFPLHFGVAGISRGGLAYYVGRTLDSALANLERQSTLALLFSCTHGPAQSFCESCSRRATETTRQFTAGLPQIRAMLGADVQAAFDGDPAATSPDEAIFCYPSTTALIHHRVAHELYRLEIPLIPRIVSELAHATTGIDIHPGARIAESFFIDHGTGVVIGETCIIGARVRIYQGVTLGAKTFPGDENGRPLKGMLRHPIIGNDVVIYAGATLLGRITVGDGATIGGNVWLTTDVEPGARVSQAHSRCQSFVAGAGI